MRTVNMLRRRFLLLTLVILTLATALVIRAQDNLFIVFIEGRDLGAAETTDVGPDGTSLFAEMLVDRGARVERITLDEPIPPEADAAVLVRPTRRLQVTHVARLWTFLRSGHRLLLAIDPENYHLDSINVRPGLGRSRLSTLLAEDYGLLIKESFLAEDYFSTDTIQNLYTSYLLAQAEPNGHPVTETLQRYNLPIWIWGSRHLDVEPIGLGSTAIPLLYTENAFGETDSTIFVDARDETVLPTPLEYNPAVDYAGRLTIAAIGKSSTTQSEVLFLSDSELLQNGYGLMTDDSVPRYSGNYVFAQGVAEWLLGFPEDEDIALPDDFTWISIDGHGDDWSDQVARYPDDTEAVPSSSYRIEQYRMFRDDQYLYIRIDTNEPPSDVTSVNLRFDVDNDGLNDVTIEIHPDGSGERRASEVRSFSDARFAVGEILELRIPLRIIPNLQRMRSICAAFTSDTSTQEQTPCIRGDLAIRQAATIALFDARLANNILVTAFSFERANLRLEPGIEFPRITATNNGTVFAAIGRDESSEWIQVQNARFEGWIARFLLAPNGDVMYLPVTYPNQE